MRSLLDNVGFVVPLVSCRLSVSYWQLSILIQIKLGLFTCSIHDIPLKQNLFEANLIKFKLIDFSYQ